MTVKNINRLFPKFANSRNMLVLSLVFFTGLVSSGIFFYFNELRNLYLIASYQLCPIGLNKRAEFSLSKELDKIDYLDTATKIQIENAINKAAINTGLPQKLILLLIKHESAFRPYAVSPVGARGLTQLMPSTAKYFCDLGMNRIFRIEDNVLCGTSYLRNLLSEFDGDLELALAAYNSGPNRIKQIQKKYKKYDFVSISHLIPRETNRYVSNIKNSYQKVV